MLQITGQDRVAAMSLARKGVLVPLERAVLSAPKGTILMACGDCDQEPDLRRRHDRGFRNSRGRHHPLMLNGGALRIAPELSGGADKVLLKDAANAIGMKNITTIAAYGHWPCGQALSSGFDFNGMVAALISTKAIIRDGVPGLEKLYHLVHIDWGRWHPFPWRNRGSYVLDFGRYATLAR
ncbi:MAG: hypothetical protein WDN10_05455 [bacterium]